MRYALLSLVLVPALACTDPPGEESEGSTGTMPTDASSASGETTGNVDGSTGDTTAPETETAASGDETGTSTSGDTGDTGDSGDTTDTGDRDCIEVDVEQWIGFGEGDNTIIGRTVPQIGDLGRNNDIVQIELYGAPPAIGMPIDVTVPPNDNYGTCDQCVRLLEDVVGTNIAKQYFVDRGTITFSDLGFTGEMAGTLENIRFIEVTLDGALNSTPVEGGDCIVLSGPTDFDTIPG